LLLAALVTCASCGGAGGDAISVSPESARIPVGGRVQLSATPPEVTWSSSNLAAVEVSDTGLATGVGLGFADVTASAGDVSRAVRVTVTEGGIIGAAGGTLRALDGAVELEVPPGAAAADSQVSVAPASVRGIDALLVARSAVALEGFTLAAPATLRLAFGADQAPLGLPRGWLRVVRLDGPTWVELATREDAGNAAAEITEPGTYALRVAESPGACAAGGHRDFDFWIGRWTVFDPSGTVMIAASTISGDAGGCLVLEDYRASGGVNGRSVSFFNPETGLWYQTYVDSAGSSALRMSGGRVGAAMVLETAPGARRTRFTWKDVGDGSVRQFSEHSNDGGATWTVGFDGTYR
jgi:hypothetical protein